MILTGRQTWQQRAGNAAVMANAERRWHIVRDASLAGTDKAEAARLAGVTVNSLNGILKRRAGSKRWPIAEPKL